MEDGNVLRDVPMKQFEWPFHKVPNFQSERLKLNGCVSVPFALVT